MEILFNYFKYNFASRTTGCRWRVEWIAYFSLKLRPCIFPSLGTRAHRNEYHRLGWKSKCFRVVGFSSMDQILRAIWYVDIPKEGPMSFAINRAITWPLSQNIEMLPAETAFHGEIQNMLNWKKEQDKQKLESRQNKRHTLANCSSWKVKKQPEMANALVDRLFEVPCFGGRKHGFHPQPTQMCKETRLHPAAPRLRLYPSSSTAVHLPLEESCSCSFTLY